MARDGHQIALVYLLFWAAIAQAGDAGGSVVGADGSQAARKQLSILVVCPTDPGHLVKIAAVGHALAQRGHNVSLCTTDREGFDRKEFITEAGMNYISAGRDAHYSLEEVLDFHHRVAQSGMVAAVQIIAEYFSNISKPYHGQLGKLGNQWDVIFVDALLYPAVACHTQFHQLDTKVIATASNYEDPTTNPWPFPFIMSPYNDDLSFFQRVEMEVPKSFVVPFFLRMLSYMQCKDLNISPRYPSAGIVHPFIAFNAFGLEYPRIVMPMVHYVGPVILQSSDALPSHLQEWLSDKKDRSVVYISMGSSVHLSNEAGNAIVDGVLRTQFDAIWSLRKSNRDFLEERELETSRVLVSDWLPQQALLKSKAVAMSISHGGMGGVSESLIQAIPLIVIPFAMDQPGVAARVQSSGAGLVLDKDTLTAEGVQRAIETVASPEYRKAAVKLRKIFLHAGGAERAADLVEFYAEVGYEHLIPAYAKYEWSWVQYYNVDVYASIIALISAFSYLTFKLCARICSTLRRSKPKIE